MEDSFYERLFEELHRRGTRYVLCGGMAVNLHGIPRLTADADIAIDFDAENVAGFVAAMSALNLHPVVPVDPTELASEESRSGWRSEKGSVVFQFVDSSRPYLKVDVFLEHPIPFGDLWSERKRLSFRGVEVPVVSIEHLIALKRMVDPPREHDLSDIDALEKVRAILEARKRSD